MGDLHGKMKALGKNRQETPETEIAVNENEEWLGWSHRQVGRGQGEN